MNYPVQATIVIVNIGRIGQYVTADASKTSAHAFVTSLGWIVVTFSPICDTDGTYAGRIQFYSPPRDAHP